MNPYPVPAIQPSSPRPTDAFSRIGRLSIRPRIARVLNAFAQILQNPRTHFLEFLKHRIIGSSELRIEWVR